MTTEAERVAAGLSDGEKMIMRRDADAFMHISDWPILRPRESAWQALLKKGCIAFWAGDGDPFWTFEPFGVEVRSILLKQRRDL